MKAVRIHQFGGPEVLQYEEVPIPTPGPGQVLVKLAAAGLNFSDVHQRTGYFPNRLPYTMGREGSGTVAAVGPQVTRSSSTCSRKSSGLKIRVVMQSEFSRSN